MFELIPVFAFFAAIAVFLFSPLIAIVIGIVRIAKYNSAKSLRAMNPDSYTDEDMKDFKKSIIAAFVTALVLGFVVISVVILLGEDITYM